MGKKSGPSAPPAPDPTVVAKAQSDSNIATAQEQQRLNMVGTSGPEGSVNYVADPSQPGGYRQVTALDPAQQAILDAQRQTELGATNIAQDQLGRVQGALRTPLDTSGLPDLRGGATPGQIQTGFGTGAPLQYSFDPGQHVQGQIDAPAQDQALKQAMDAVYGQATSRLDPQWQLREEQQTQRLADQGISEGSDAYGRAMDQLGRDRNDAYSSARNAAITQGQSLEGQLFGQAAERGQFANTAAAQQYGQNQGVAAFHNTTAGQDFGQNRDAATFANQAEGQQFAQQQARSAADNAARQQGLQERAYIENQPINQLTGLLSLGQVSNPQGIQYTPSQVQPTDVLGAYALNQQAQNAAFQARSQQQSGAMSGLFSLGSAALLASDRRLKRDVRLIRRRRDGVGVYRFRYRSGGPEQVGVMAQELKRVRPDLVVRGPDGMLAVDYAGLGAL